MTKIKDKEKICTALDEIQSNLLVVLDCLDGNDCITQLKKEITECKNAVELMEVGEQVIKIYSIASEFKDDTNGKYAHSYMTCKICKHFLGWTDVITTERGQNMIPSCAKQAYSIGMEKCKHYKYDLDPL